MSLQYHPKDKILNVKLTWAIELEFLFAYKDEVIKDLLSRTGGAFELVKSIPRKERQYDISKSSPFAFTTTPDIELPNHAHNSWGVREIGVQNAKNQPLILEPVRLAHEKIRRHASDLPIEVQKRFHESLNIKDKHDTWTVSTARTAPGVGPRNVYQRLAPNKRFERGARTRWDSFGVKLISPVFETEVNRKDRSHGDGASISEILAAVTAEERGTDAFITNQCGLHVHIGDLTGGFKLAELQTLAYLLVIYEEELSTLHPPSRRPGHRVSYDNIESNRSGLILERRPNAEKLFVDDFWHYTRSMQQSQDFTDMKYKKHISVRGIKKWATDQTSVDGLVQRFNWHGSEDRPGLEHGNRLRQVNFVPLVRTDGEEFPKMIEFRAARGTLEEDEVMRWVEVCLGLVRLAKYYAVHPEEFPVDAWDDVYAQGDEESMATGSRINVFDLLNLMGMEKEGVEWWEDRKARWSNVMSLLAEERRNNEHFRDDLEDLSVPDDAEEGEEEEEDEATSSIPRLPPPTPTARRTRAGNDTPTPQDGSPRMRYSNVRRRGGAQLPSPSAAADATFGSVQPSLWAQNWNPDRTRRRLFENATRSRPGAPVGSDLPPDITSDPRDQSFNTHIQVPRHESTGLTKMTDIAPTSAPTRLKGPPPPPPRPGVIVISDDEDGDDSDAEDTGHVEILSPGYERERTSPASSPPTAAYSKRNRDGDAVDDSTDKRGKRRKHVHFA